GVICKRQHSRFAWRALVGTASKPAAIWNRQGADEGVAGQGRSPDWWRHRPAPFGRARPGTGRHYRISRRAGGAAQVDLDAEELIALFDGRPSPTDLASSTCRFLPMPPQSTRAKVPNIQPSLSPS